MKKAVNLLELEVKPYSWQVPIRKILKKTMYCLMVVARQHGKTELMLWDLLDFCLTTKRKDPVVVIAASTIEQALDIYWFRMLKLFKKYPEHLIEFSRSARQIIIKRPYRGDQVVIRLFGSENATGVEGMAVDYLLIDELGLWPPGRLAMSFLPARRKKKGFVRIIGTVRGLNDFYNFYFQYFKEMEEGNKSYFCTNVDAHTACIKGGHNPMTLVELAEEEKAYRDRGEYHVWLQAYMGDWFANIEGAYFRNEMLRVDSEKRICEIKLNPLYPVYTVWDLGLCGTAIWYFQAYNGKYYFLKYQEFQNRGTEDLIMNVLAKSEYATMFKYHLVPFDAQFRDKHRKSRLFDDMNECFIRYRIGEAILVEDARHVKKRIDETRKGFPKCVFDKVNCDEGIKCIRMYSRVKNKKTGTFTDKPDKQSPYQHGFDALTHIFVYPKLGNIMNAGFQYSSDVSPVKMVLNKQTLKYKL